MSTESQPIIETDYVRLLTAKELSQRLKISVRGVWRQVSVGAIPGPIYIGRLARWPLRTIETWMEQGCPATADKTN